METNAGNLIVGHDVAGFYATIGVERIPLMYPLTYRAVAGLTDGYPMSAERRAKGALQEIEAGKPGLFVALLLRENATAWSDTAYLSVETAPAEIYRLELGCISDSQRLYEALSASARKLLQLSKAVA